METVELWDKKGFTPIEFFITVGVIFACVGLFYVAVNPGRLQAEARVRQRQSTVNTLVRSFGSCLDRTGGVMSQALAALPIGQPIGLGVMATDCSIDCPSAATANTCLAAADIECSLGAYLVPDILSELPSDPGSRSRPAGAPDYYVLKVSDHELVVGACAGELTAVKGHIQF